MISILNESTGKYIDIRSQHVRTQSTSENDISCDFKELV